MPKRLARWDKHLAFGQGPGSMIPITRPVRAWARSGDFSTADGLNIGRALCCSAARCPLHVTRCRAWAVPLSAACGRPRGPRVIRPLESRSHSAWHLPTALADGTGHCAVGKPGGQDRDSGGTAIAGLRAATEVAGHWPDNRIVASFAEDT